MVLMLTPHVPILMFRHSTAILGVPVLLPFIYYYLEQLLREYIPIYI